MNGATTAVHYVGRTEHRAAVRRAFREPGHIVVVCGEAGVGKSALVAAERLASTTEVIDGFCLTIAGRPLPLAALEQIFEARGGWPEVPDGSEQSAEQRLKAVRRWADALAPVGSANPLTLVVEDLHWADETTCDFLVYLACTAVRRGVSLVLTLRNDETPRVPRVQQAVAELSRLPGAENVEIERLDRTEARELVAALTGGAEVDVDAWYAQSQGNPFLLGELVKDPGARRVKDVLLARVRALGGDAAELVGLAAVFGLWVADDDLFAASGLSPDRYAAAVREALDAGVLAVEDTNYAFRHSLLCEAVINRLLPIERRILHERAARALAAGGADDVVTATAISLHWTYAGMTVEAAEWSLRAARKARSLNAFAEAWSYYQRAHEPSRMLGSGAEDLELVMEATGTARLAGDPATAAAALEKALAAGSPTDPVRAAALERLGCFQWEAGQTARSRATYAEAAAALGPDVSAVHAQVWGALARGAFIMAGFDEAVRLAERSMAAAREHGARVVLADALITRGAATSILGDPAGLDLIREGISLARVVEDGAVVCRGFANLIVALEYTGRPAEAAVAALEGLGLLPEYGLELAVGAALACNAASMLRRRGDYARCAAVLADLLEGRVVQGQGLHLHLERAELQLVMGDVVGARASLTAAAPLQEVDEPAVVAAIATVTAELLAQEGDPDGCFRTVDIALRRLAGTQDTVFRLEILLIGLRTEADRVGTVPGRDLEAEARADRLATELVDLEPAEDADVGQLAHYRTARSELARIRGTATVDDWADAARLWAEAERPREQAYCLLRRAEGHVAARQREKAALAAGEARALAADIGAAPVVAEVDALVARTRLSAAPPPRSPVEDRPYGLTERELEILAELGTGATNRQIARKLFISERTVGVHVSRVLHKLQVTNRAQAAALAVKVTR